MALRRIRSRRSGRFKFPTNFALTYGYPKLTAEIKAKIFGLNGARIYGIDPRKYVKERRCRAEDPAGLVGKNLIRLFLTYGPKTSGEYKRFLVSGAG